MSERKVKIVNPAGKTVDGVEMDVEESIEKWSQFTFPDGTVMRAKLSIATATRLEGEYDQEGNPLYATRMTPTMILSSVPDHLKRKTQ
jgi:hypothetical protein